MSDKPEAPSEMNDADNYALDHGYEWDKVEPCPDCGSPLWSRIEDVFDGEITEESVMCSNCGYNDVRYDA